MKWRQVRFVLLGALVILACVPTPKRYIALLESKSGSTAVGSATFVPTDGKIHLGLTVDKAPPGTHAVHIHNVGDCSSADGLSAGGHWNPAGSPHGKLGEPTFHLGDIGNFVVGADGKGTLSFDTDRWTAAGAGGVSAAFDGGTNDIVGHAVIVHGGVDDYASQPTGDAGSRIACGVIKEIAE